MRALQYEVLVSVDERLFRARVPAPEDKHDVLFFIAYQLDDAVGEPRPAAVLVRVGAVRAHGQRGVEEQNALLCPLGQVARFGDFAPDVVAQFLKDVDERRGRLNALLHRKAQSVRLPHVVVGVLPQ